MRIKYCSNFLHYFQTQRILRLCKFLLSRLETYYYFLQLSSSLDTSSNFSIAFNDFVDVIFTKYSSQITYQGPNITTYTMQLTSKKISFLIVSCEYLQASGLVSIKKLDFLMSANFADNIITLLSKLSLSQVQIVFAVLFIFITRRFKSCHLLRESWLAKYVYSQSALWFQDYTICYAQWPGGSVFQKIFAFHGLYFVH